MGIDERVAKLVDNNRLQGIGEAHPLIKRIKGIISNSRPNPEKLFVAEGLWLGKLVADNIGEVESLIICPECIYTPEGAQLAERLVVISKESYTVSAKTFQKIAEKEKPDGVLALAKLPRHDIKDLTLDSKAVVLIMDGVEIPGNMGTMVRVADGAGTDAIFVVNRKARLTHPKFIHSTMGAIFTVPIIEFDSVESCFNYLISKDFTIYLADSRAEKMYYELPYGNRTAFVLGSERYGISREWYDKNAELLAIPMLGKCDSLNVGVAATVLLYEACVKNRLMTGGNKN